MIQEICTKCNNGNMIEKHGSKGAFMACNQYPKCENTENMPEGSTTAPAAYEKQGKPVAMPSGGMYSPKDCMIMAQTFTKCFYYGNKAEDLDAVLNTYNYYFGELANAE